MKWVLRTLVFGIALVLGVGCASIVNAVFYQDRSTPVDGIESREQSLRPSVSGTGVRVTYEGWDPGTSEMQPNLKFRIYNDSWEPLTYSAHSREGLFPQLTVNGKRVETFYCGTGMTDHYLLPGDSIVVKVGRYDFRSRPARKDLITAGFYFRSAFASGYSVYRSEPMSLPEEFRMTIGSL